MVSKFWWACIVPSSQCLKETHSLGCQLSRLAHTKTTSFLPVPGCWSRQILLELVIITRLNPNSQVLGSSALSFDSQNLFGIWNHSPKPGYPVIKKVGLTTYGSPFLVSVFLLDALTCQFCLCYTEQRAADEAVSAVCLDSHFYPDIFLLWPWAWSVKGSIGFPDSGITKIT